MMVGSMHPALADTNEDTCLAILEFANVHSQHLDILTLGAGLLLEECDGEGRLEAGACADDEGCCTPLEED
jgi:hypothetical protein